MLEIVYRLVERQQLVVRSSIVIVVFVLISLLSLLIQSYHSDIASHIQSTYSNQASQSSSGGSPNAITNAFSNISANTSSVIDVIEAKTLSGIMGASTAITHSEKAVADGFYTVIATVAGSIKVSCIFVGHLATTATRGFYGFATTTFRFERSCLILPLRFASGGFSFSLHTLDKAYGSVSGISNLDSIIQPKDTTALPVITQIQIKQAAIIQSGTTSVALPTVTNGTGGACDAGSGNGSYPMTWCNASMDTVSTVPYSSDRINRECTSYTYWYFADVEGHTNFHASGNAKYWATSSNYPTSTTPSVGAIAVETAGAYGHTAIVQALPGQDYEGSVVPSGYVLVSEMNYDWHGHFRYSYSPLSKFSTYIHP